MRRIRGGLFRAGSETFYRDEGPVRDCIVADFWIDRTPVTNRQFARFVAATGHVTFAERSPDWRDYPGMEPALAVPGSIVFVPPLGPAELTDEPTWWHFVAGACWRQPMGPGSGLHDLERHPVVHVAPCDAEAYAAWAGKALPTEGEWEYAARGGLDGADYAWGDSFMPAGRRMAKTWDGLFPWFNAAPAGLERTAPVRSYPANGYGLYDMIGNVWEWTCDIYDGPDVAPRKATCCTAAGGARAIERRVLKGGSHLCAPEYCERYRPAARWPQPIDTTTSHVGFRCVQRD